MRYCAGAADIFEGLRQGVLHAWEIGKRHDYFTIDRAIKDGFTQAKQLRQQVQPVDITEANATNTTNATNATRPQRRSDRLFRGSRTMSPYDPGLHHGSSQLERPHTWQYRENTTDELDGIADPPPASAPPIPNGMQSTYTRLLTEPSSEEQQDLDRFDLQAFIDGTLHDAQDDDDDDDDNDGDEDSDDDDGDDDDGDDNNEDLRCCICFSRKSNVILDPCRHAFCSSCVCKIRRRNKPCPVCRTGIGYIVEDLTLD